MDDGGLKQLRALLRDRAAHAAAEAVDKGGALPPEEVESLRNLSSLCATLEATVAKPKPNRWLPVALFVLALACASLLLFRRVAVTHVVIDATATSGEFRLSQTRSLTDTAVLTSIRLTGIRKLSGELCAELSGGKAPKDLTLVAENGKAPGTITLQPIEARKGQSVALLAGDSPTRWSFSFSGKAQPVKVTIEGFVKVDGEPCRIEAKFPRTLEADLDERSARIVLEFSKPPAQLLPPLLPIDRLAFLRTDMVELEGGLERQESSTFTGGSIFFEELEGKETKLRDGEWLDIGVREGWLRAPRAAGPSLAWRYRGSVDALRSGPPDSRRDLKPSWLEYARAQHGMELLWGTALSLFGLGGTLLRWLKT